MKGDTSTFHEAMYYREEKGRLRCDLCPHRCIVEEGRYGICGVRKNINGKMYSTVYGRVSSIAMDPIEKKPLFHFHPGSWIFSISTVGCNLKCKHCQNWEISQASLESMNIPYHSPEEIVAMARSEGSGGIAFTYNEPTIWYEYTLDVGKISKGYGMYNVYVTNGYINEDPLRGISRYIDAMNIDVKGFTDEFYRKITGGRLQPVLDTVSIAKELGIHVELTYLIIPTLNDDENEIRNFSRWARETLGEDGIVHFSRFHPDYLLINLPETPVKTMHRAYEIAREEGLNYVYLGNLWEERYETTYCPKCGAPLIKRSGYHVRMENITQDGRCSRCGTKIPLVM